MHVFFYYYSGWKVFKLASSFSSCSFFPLTPLHFASSSPGVKMGFCCSGQGRHPWLGRCQKKKDWFPPRGYYWMMGERGEGGEFLTDGWDQILGLSLSLSSEQSSRCLWSLRNGKECSFLWEITGPLLQKKTLHFSLLRSQSSSNCFLLLLTWKQKMFYKEGFFCCCY